MLLFAFIFSLIFGFENNTSSQNKLDESFHIIFIQGTIQMKSSGETLKRGMQLKSSEKIVFKSKDAKAVVLSTTKGRFVLAPKQATASSELTAFVSEVVSPLKTNSKLSTRAGESEKGIQDLKTHFGKVKDDFIPSFAIIGEEYLFKVDITKYPMNIKEKILGVTYVKENQTINKPKGLTFQKNVATLSKNLQFKGIDLASIDYIKIHQIDMVEKKIVGEELASFKPIFIDSEELKASFQEYLSKVNINEALTGYLTDEKTTEAEVSQKISKMNDVSKKRELLYFFMQECYGQFDENGKVDVQKLKIDEKSLENWLTQNNF